MTKPIQIEEQLLEKLTKLKSKIKAHNMSEVIDYLLTSEKENKQLTDKVNDIENRLLKLEGGK